MNARNPLLRAAVLALLLARPVDGTAIPVKSNENTNRARLDRPAPGFTLKDVNGNTHSLSNYRGKYVVLEWINFDCPFVKKHYESGNMQKLQKEYAKKGVVWLTVCSSAPGKQGYFEVGEVRSRLKRLKGMQTAYLVDADGHVGKMYEAKTTPNMYVIDPEGKLLYAGAIDDKPSPKLEDAKTATNYVQAALDAAMTGNKIRVNNSPPYGCSIKYKE